MNGMRHLQDRRGVKGNSINTLTRKDPVIPHLRQKDVVGKSTSIEAPDGERPRGYLPFQNLLGKKLSSENPETGVWARARDSKLV